MANFRRLAIWCSIPVTLAAFSAGCGSDELTAGPPGPPAKAEIQASEGQDRQIGLELQDYLVHYCPSPNAKLAARLEHASPRSFSPKELVALGPISLCYSISTIAVEDSRVTIRSGLENDARGRMAGEAFCMLMYSADVADLTPGHELQDKEGNALKVCPNDQGEF